MHLDMIGLGRMGADVVCVVYNRSDESVAELAGGGIASKKLPLLQSGAFLEAFLDKGRMRHLLQIMPVKVILNDRAALYGSALHAAQPSGETA